jgi:hypothetical protein
MVGRSRFGSSRNVILGSFARRRAQIDRQALDREAQARQARNRQAADAREIFDGERNSRIASAQDSRQALDGETGTGGSKSGWLCKSFAQGAGA